MNFSHPTCTQLAEYFVVTDLLPHTGSESVVAEEIGGQFVRRHVHEASRLFVRRDQRFHFPAKRLVPGTSLYKKRRPFGRLVLERRME